MSEIVKRVTKVTVLPKGEPIFGEMVLDVYIDDEASGEFVVVESKSDHYGKIAINPEEWPILKQVIDVMFENILLAER